MIDPKSSFQPHMPLETRLRFSRICHWKWLLTGRSYRNIMIELRRALSANANCVAGSNLGDAQRAMLDYYIRLTTKRMENREGADCQLLIVQGVASKESPVSVLCTKIWEGNRPGDKVERLRLYRRDIE